MIHIDLKKETLIDRLMLSVVALQIGMVIVGAIYPTDIGNYIMYILNYSVGFLALISILYRGIAKHFLILSFLAFFMLFLMGQKPFKPEYNVFLTFAWVRLDKQQYVMFASILFIGLAVTYYSYMYFAGKEKREVFEREVIDRTLMERIVAIMIVITFPFALYMQAKVVFVKSGMDYTTGYLINVDMPASIKIAYYLYEALVLIYLALKPQKRRMFLVLSTYLLVEGGVQLLQGRRALFAATFVFCLWYVLKYFNLNNITKKAFLVLFGLLIGVVALFIIVEQTRDGEVTHFSFDTIKDFLVSTGGSDSVIANTIVRKGEFPNKGIMYLLDPIINNFTGNLLCGKEGVPQGVEYISQHNSFSHWLSYLTESTLYLSGHGMGSSYLAEVFLAFGVPGVAVVSIVIGWLVDKLDCIVIGKRIHSTTWGFFFARRLFTLPRDSLFGWVGDSVYLIFTLLLVGLLYLLCSRMFKRNKNKCLDVDYEDLGECKTVTVGIIAYNEQQYLPDLLRDVLCQTWEKNKTEVILVDSMSTDNTREIMNRFQQEHFAEYLSIKVMENPPRIQPAGWNAVIACATADVIVRIDAHAKLPKDFIEKSMRCINSGEYVCGGPRENVIDCESLWKKVLLDAEQMLFGSGFAAYRRGTPQKRYVKTLFHGAYRREVFDTVGQFDERLVRTEDNEIHYRIRKSGYRICYDPAIQSYYQTRNTLLKMLKQKYQNGLWIGKTMHVCPNCLSLFHFAPMVFDVALLICALLAFLGIKWMLAVLVATYYLFVIANTLICYFNTNNCADVVLPGICFLMHFVYGIGTAVGFSKGIRK